MESKNFSVPTILSLTTGFLITENFGDMHELAEYVAGRSIWTHEFVSRELGEQLKNQVYEQHPQLQEAEKLIVGISTENWSSYRDEMIKRFGETLPINKGQSQRTETPIDSAIRIINDIKK